MRALLLCPVRFAWRVRRRFWVFVTAPHHHLHPPDNAIHKPHLYALGVEPRVREELPHDAPCQSPRALVLFQNDVHLHAHGQVAAVAAIRGTVYCFCFVRGLDVVNWPTRNAR
jgi:hypothetical protein